MINKTEQGIMENWTSLETPLVSISALAYNHEKYIEDAMDGMLMQETTFPFEIIVHDDASTDNTANIIKQYAEKFPNIVKPILQTENQWSKKKKRVGSFVYEKARGKYLALCECDDYWIDANKLQIQIDEMCKFKNCQMSFHSAIDKWEDNSRKDEVRTKQANGNKLFTAKEIILGGGGFCPTASLVLEKEVASNLPEWYQRAPFTDYYQQILGSVKGGALYIDRTMSIYRRNTVGSWSMRMLDIEKRERQFENMVETLDEMDSYFDEKFHLEIAHEKSKQYYDMAVFYLNNDMFEKFKKHIEFSHQVYPIKTLFYFIDYHLRYFPRLIKNLKKLKIKLKHETFSFKKNINRVD